MIIAICGNCGQGNYRETFAGFDCTSCDHALTHADIEVSYVVADGMLFAT